MQKLHKGRCKLIGKVLSSFSQHVNYFNMNNMGPGIFHAWTHWTLNGERKTSGSTTEEVKCSLLIVYAWDEANLNLLARIISYEFEKANSCSIMDVQWTVHVLLGRYFIFGL
jgi:hypothetical protein